MALTLLSLRIEVFEFEFSLSLSLIFYIHACLFTFLLFFFVQCIFGWSFVCLPVSLIRSIFYLFLFFLCEYFTVSVR